MTHLDCAVGLLGVQAPPLPLRLAEKQIESFIAEASATNGTPAITIGFHPPQDAGLPLSPLQPVAAVDLHKATRSLAPNPPAGQRVSRIALLFAHSYKDHSALFGLMFDRGFTTDDDGNSSVQFTGFPRQGCAVFLGAIAAQRAGADFEAEVAYTAVHELGHLFNLGHVETSRCFMSQSKGTVAPTSAFRFRPHQEQRLRLGSSSVHVWPGGSKFNDIGELTPDPDETFDAPTRFGLELTIEMCQREFHAFEPVELEIRLAVVPGVRRKFELPSVIDPGYGAFDIWIESPDRERHRYRPCNYYCTNAARIGVAPGRPFERDVSIFGQSGGYTFRRAGLHRIWAELRLSRLGALKSNKVEVFVLPQPIRGRRERLRSLLVEPAAGRTLFYRRATDEGRGVAALNELCRRFPKEPSAAASHYALGRAFVQALHRADPNKRPRILERARDHLEKAIDHELLSDHRRIKAQEARAALL